MYIVYWAFITSWKLSFHWTKNWFHRNSINSKFCRWILESWIYVFISDLSVILLSPFVWDIIRSFTTFIRIAIFSPPTISIPPRIIFQLILILPQYGLPWATPSEALFANKLQQFLLHHLTKITYDCNQSTNHRIAWLMNSQQYVRISCSANNNWKCV